MQIEIPAQIHKYFVILWRLLPDLINLLPESIVVLADSRLRKKNNWRPLVFKL